MRISDWSSDVCSSDLLIDCQPRDRRQLICLRETSLKPRHLAAIDLDRGRAHIIADFNPEFSRLKMGRAQRIMLQSSVGIQACRSEERRVGKEGVSTCSSRWSRYQ